MRLCGPTLFREVALGSVASASKTADVSVFQTDEGEPGASIFCLTRSHELRVRAGSVVVWRQLAFIGRWLSTRCDFMHPEGIAWLVG